MQSVPPTPSAAIERDAKNSCPTSVARFTAKSIVANSAARCARSVIAWLTIWVCAKYRNVDVSV
jgi:hypothetical protein